jgi:diacylglycerol kinase family enzyme
MANDGKGIRAKLIANPTAGAGQETTAKLRRVSECLLAQGLNVDVALAHPIKEAIPSAKKAVKNGYPMVIAMGGDGTIGAVIAPDPGTRVEKPQAATMEQFLIPVAIPVNHDHPTDGA